MRINADEKELHGLTLFNLRTYLQSRGWTSGDNADRKSLVFFGPRADSGRPLEIILPRSEDFTDYYARVADAVNLLAAIDDVSPAKIVFDIRCNNNDFVRFRVKSSGALDSMPLAEAARDTAALKSLFAYGACSETEARPHFDALTASGIRHADTCQFDHTFRGSFGFVVRSPVVKENEQGDIFKAPFERRVVERIARGLLITEKAVSTDDYDVLVSAYPDAFNSRMCEALDEMSAQSQREVEISISWATTVPVASDLASLGAITLSEKYFDCLRYAAGRLKEVLPESVAILGRVVNLHSNSAPGDRTNDGTVTVKYQHHDLKSIIDVRLRLSRSQYVEAARAHIEGKLVRAVGVLEKNGSIWELVGITEFEVEEQSNNGMEPTR